MVVAAVLVVAPYSASVSSKYDNFVISDATLGHVMHLGNNDFPPVTFDYGIGQLTGPVYARTLRSGRPDCRQKHPVEHDRCEVANALTWIDENRGEFVARIPMRLA